MSKKKARRSWGSALLAAAMLVNAAPTATLTVAAYDDADSSREASSQTQLNTAVIKGGVQYIDTGERSIDFDKSWSFHFGEASGAEQSLYDDSKWEVVNVPHDYSITQDYDENMEPESAYLPGGTGWYRKSFVLSENAENKRVSIDFDGVYMNATVYINGHKLGDHPYGYSPFSFDLSDYLNREGENVISVRVDHRIPSSRWYSGSGIHRDVKLTVTDNVHVARYGTQITSPNLETQKDGAVDTLIKTTVSNDGDADKSVSVRQSIRKRGTNDVISSVTGDPLTLAAGSTQVIDQTLVINTPDLWSTEDPNLYTITTEILEGEAVVDSYDTSYGYRWFNFDKDTGFSLNGVSMKLNGVCMHHDQGALGSVDTRRAVERQVEIMQEMGVNAIRTSHNPASQALLDVCEERGIMVMEEFFDGWSTTKNGNTEDYHNYFNMPIGEDNEIVHGAADKVWSQFDLQEVIYRGRNNPAIIIWDIGNEIEHGDTSEFPQICDNLIRWTQEVDYRPIVLGDNKTLGNATSTSNVIRDKIAASGGLIGSNYGIASDLQYRFRNAHPDWLFLGTENVSSTNSRGIYDRINNNTDINSDRQLTSYDYSCVGWGHRASQAVLGFLQNDWYAGEFVWTGFDYLGEPTPWWGSTPGTQGFGWPAPKSSYFGIVDTAGFEKDTYYLYRSLWNKSDTTLHMLPAWKDGVVYKNGQNKVPVVVYTNAHKVKLEITHANGKVDVIGEKEFTEKTTDNGYKWRIYEGADKEGNQDKNLYFTWYVPYEDGTLTATAYDEAGNEIKETVGRKSVTTFGDATQLKATADRTEITADGKDLSYIAVDVLDAEGRFVSNATDRVTFDVQGAGRLVGVDNGNALDIQSFQDDNRNAFSGKVLAIVESTEENGTITVTASADGLESSTVTINTVNAKTPQKVIDHVEYVKGCYLKAGSTPQLPETASLYYEDGTVEENVSIDWDEFSIDELNESGTVHVNGTANGQKLTFYINVINEVGSVQSYSAAVRTGTKPELPATRPVLAPDGNKMPIYAPVTWEEIPDGAWNTPGTYVVKGVADVLGEDYPVTATLTIKDESLVRQPNVVSKLAYRITQNIPEDLQSDNLLAIKDGDTKPADPVKGYNAKVWSNFNSTNADTPNRHNEITIYLDTGQNLNEANIYFCADTWSMVYPEPGSVKFEVSGTGEDGSWKELETTETIGEEITTSGVAMKSKQYNYTFTPQTATVIRISFDTQEGQTTNAKYASGISEVELFPVVPSLEQGSSTALASLKINGKDEGFTNTTADTLESTAYLVDTIEAIGADNASVTVLPADGNTIRLLVEAEDHSSSRIVTVTIQKPYRRDPASAEYDIPSSSFTASSPSVYPGTGQEGPLSNLFDNNPNTWYHSNYNNNSASSVENRRIDLTFDTPTKVGGLRLLPRNSAGDGGRNGTITTYKIQYQETANGPWIDLAEGDWAIDGQWKSVDFDEEVTAKAVRLIGVHTFAASGDDAHMTAAELRLCTAFPQENIENVSGFSVNWPASIPSNITIGDLDLHNEIEVSADDELHYGTDYYFTYDFDTAKNEVTVTLKGNAYYNGSVSKTYKVGSISQIDTTLLELTIAAGDSLIGDAASYTGTEALSSTLSKGKEALEAKVSQKAVNDAAKALNKALLDVRLIPDKEKLSDLK